MSQGARRSTAGLGSRVAVRTFLLFCACAAVPVALFGVFGYRYISQAAGEQAAARLQDASKRYGLLLNDRLAQADSSLLDAAQANLARSPDASPAPESAGSRVRLVSVRQLPLPITLPEGIPADATPSVASDRPLPRGMRLLRSMQVVVKDGQPQVQLKAVLLSDGRGVEVVGTVLPNYLWDSDSVTLVGGRVCVLVNGKAAHCSDPALQSGKTLTATWELFLKPRYGADTWRIVVEQRADVALAALQSFKATLPLTAGITFGVALLLSSIHIRRSHRPLALLTEAARRMSQGRFRERVQITGRDEYANLAQAFNRMASNIQRQFRVLSTFAGVDRQILALPSVEPIIASVLPRVLRALSCEGAAVLLGAGDQHECTLTVSSRLPGPAISHRRVSVPGEQFSRLAAADGRDLAVDEVAALGLAEHVPGAILWRLAFIKVANTIRGFIFVGYAKRSGRRGRFRQLAGLARRIAVAIGNEDRERALLRQAYYDSLTGLPNRQLFKDRLDQELVRAQRNSTALALLFIDLDHFKNVNDSLGHSAGDALLQAAAARLRTVVPEEATLSRLGGDEFTIVLSVRNAQTAASLAAQIHSVLNVPFSIAGAECPVQASVGIALYPEDATSAEDLLRNADTAMYRAKAEGRARAAFFEEAMNVKAKRRLRLAQRLRAALDERRLQLVYQPKVCAETGHLAGVEALARWTDPEEGVICPTEFIPLAEECGLIERLGDWALDEACSAMQQWQRCEINVPHVAVNVSMHQLRDETFPARVHECLRAHSLNSNCLELEITESSLAADMQAAIGLLKSLQAIGVRIAIDDFGTGYSSMAALAELPADVLKIDRAFVTGCTSSVKAATLLRGLIAVAHAMGKEVVAEGVETQSQVSFLQAERCEILQGFYFSRGLDADDVAEFASDVTFRRESA